MRHISLHNRIAGLTLAVLLICVTAIAPSAARKPSASNPACPTISCESSTPAPLIQFTVDDGSNTTSYHWTVSSGDISSGQDTKQISVSNVPVGQSCEAKVSMTGVPAGCSDKLTCTTTISPPACPTINVSCPSDVEEGSPVTFTASVGGGGSSATFNWSVSAGTITSGQGTSSITVSTDNLRGQTITATLEVGGISASCMRNKSCSVAVKPPGSFKFDEFDSIGLKVERLRLDKFADALLNLPTAQGYLITNGRSTRSSQWRAAKIKEYLVNRRGVNRARIVCTNAKGKGTFAKGKGTFRIEFWIVMAGASPPKTSLATPQRRNHF